MNGQQRLDGYELSYHSTRLEISKSF
uniref:Uncharacterized protein n=1 Tax=Arundo donax TaxID=35708 RepID=A0A0A9DNL5_ARUDO